MSKKSRKNGGHQPSIRSPRAAESVHGREIDPFFEFDFPPHLLDEMKRMLREPDPTVFLRLASSWFTFAPPEGWPDDGDEHSNGMVPQLVDAFSEFSYAQTSAGLAAIAALTDDAVLKEQIALELVFRNHPMPTWLKHMDEATLSSEVFRAYNRDDHGFDIIFEIKMADGSPLFCLFYLDHNWGGAVREAMIGGRPLSEIIGRMQTEQDGFDVVEPMDVATARAVIEHGLTLTAAAPRVVRPDDDPDEDPWEMQIPLLLWCLRLLPDGGEVPDANHWYPGHETCEFGSSHDDSDRDLSDEDLDIEAVIAVTNLLVNSVGDPEKVLAIDSKPLPDEPFDFNAVPHDLRDTVAELLRLCDECANDIFNPEYRTAFRRFIAMVVVGDPNVLRRKAAIPRTAAAIATAVDSLNFLNEGVFDRLTNKQIREWFGVTSTVSSRVESLVAAAGGAASGVEIYLPDATLLVSGHRKCLMELRDDRVPPFVWETLIKAEQLRVGGGRPSDYIEYFTTEGLEFDSIEDANKFMEVITEVINNTRIYENNGFTPSELFLRMERGKLRPLPSAPFRLS